MSELEQLRQEAEQLRNQIQVRANFFILKFEHFYVVLAMNKICSLVCQSTYTK